MTRPENHAADPRPVGTLTDVTNPEPPEAQHVDVRVTSRDASQLSAFVAFCKTVEHLGHVGASRTVEVFVDGDGAANLRFDFGDTDTSDVEPLDPDDDDMISIGD